MDLLTTSAQEDLSVLINEQLLCFGASMAVVLLQTLSGFLRESVRGVEGLSIGIQPVF